MNALQTKNNEKEQFTPLSLPVIRSESQQRIVTDFTSLNMDYAKPATDSTH